MALPSSGPLGINDIRSYFSTSEGNLRILSTDYASFPDPYAISNFYGYETCPGYGTYIGEFCEDCVFYYILADGNCGTFDQLQSFNYAGCGPQCGGGGYYCAEPPFYNCAIYPNPCWYYGYADCLTPA